MALRLMLVSMVVSMSLPMPNSDGCKLFLNEFHHEVGAIWSTIENEWPSQSVAGLSQKELSKPELAVIANQAPGASTKANKIIESPLDLAFGVIIEEYAKQANLEQAMNEIKKIPAQIDAAPLPPAPPAADLINAKTLVQSNDVKKIELVHTKYSLWNTLEWSRMINLTETSQAIEIEPLATEPLKATPEQIVHRNLSGPGMWADGKSADLELDLIQAIEDLAYRHEPASEPANHDVETFAQTEWFKILNNELFSTTTTPNLVELKPETEVATATNQVSVRKALQLTVETIAAWSQIISKPY